MEMKPACETCGKPLAQDGVAFVCSYTCTFCVDCTAATQHICPNCQGELVRRPRRKVKA